MCGRYTLKSPPAVIAQTFGVPTPATLPQRFNIAPSQLVLAVRAAAGGPDRELVAFTWGLVPFWANDPAIGNRMINARSETAATKPAFRASFRSRRCLIIADGFYEWQARGSSKQPYYFQLESGEPFGFAGLWDRWQAGDAQSLETCTILTCAANDTVQTIHDRMPVIIPPEHFSAWLDPAGRDAGGLTQLLRPLPAETLTAYPVSRMVNSVRTDTPNCVNPVTL